MRFAAVPFTGHTVRISSVENVKVVFPLVDIFHVLNHEFTEAASETLHNKEAARKACQRWLAKKNKEWIDNNTYSHSFSKGRKKMVSLNIETLMQHIDTLESRFAQLFKETSSLEELKLACLNQVNEEIHEEEMELEEIDVRAHVYASYDEEDPLDEAEDRSRAEALAQEDASNFDSSQLEVPLLLLEDSPENAREGEARRDELRRRPRWSLPRCRTCRVRRAWYNEEGATEPLLGKGPNACGC